MFTTSNSTTSDRRFTDFGFLQIIRIGTAASGTIKMVAEFEFKDRTPIELVTRSTTSAFQGQSRGTMFPASSFVGPTQSGD